MELCMQDLSLEVDPKGPLRFHVIKSEIKLIK